MALKTDIKYVAPHLITDNARGEKEKPVSTRVPIFSTDGQLIYGFPDAGAFSAKTRPVPSKVGGQAL